MIESLLKRLGFNEKEADVYLAILQYGKILPADLAKATNLPRTTIYSISKQLVKRGVITEDLGGPVRYLVASSPQDLTSMVQKEEKTLEQKKKLVQDAIKELQGLSETARYAIPKIIFVPEEDLENHLYKRSPIWNESIMKYDGHWWGFQDKSFVRHYEKWIDWYWQTGSPKNMKLKLLSNESAEALKDKKYPNRKIKFWKGEQDFTATIWINGDYLVMIVTNQHPFYLVEIHDVTLAHNLRELFKGMWEETKR